MTDYLPLWHIQRLIFSTWYQDKEREMTKAKIDAPVAEDVRVLLGNRNRDRITDAFFELIESGELIPTAEQVAQRAG
ncbi:MAG: hypothetical protein AAEJ52_16545, partial [Myxococcota bacterium]